MMGNLLSRSLVFTLATVGIIYTLRFFFQGYSVRSKMIKLQKRGLVGSQVVVAGFLLTFSKANAPL